MRWRSIICGLGLVAAVGVVLSQRTASVSGGGPAAPVECTGPKAVDFKCHEQRYTRLVRQEGSGPALRALEADQARNGYVRAACHQLTHRVGRAAGDERGIDALREGRSVCVSGFYHGVLQSVMSKLGRRGSIERADSICADLRSHGRPSAEHYNCVHGLGHGFMAVYGNDVFESLHGCRSVHDPWEQEECSGGVFMENVTAIDDRIRPSRYLRPAEPLYPCTEVAERLWDQCYDWQVTYALYVNDSDFAKVFRLCAGGVRAARAPCYRGLGGDALQQSRFVTSAAGRRATMRRLCELAPDRRAQTNCIEGVVKIMFRDYVDGDAQARSLCRSLTDELRAACLAAEAKARRDVALPEAGGA